MTHQILLIYYRAIYKILSPGSFTRILLIVIELCQVFLFRKILKLLNESLDIRCRLIDQDNQSLRKTLLNHSRKFSNSDK